MLSEGANSVTAAVEAFGRSLHLTCTVTWGILSQRYQKTWVVDLEWTLRFSFSVLVRVLSFQGTILGLQQYLRFAIPISGSPSSRSALWSVLRRYHLPIHSSSILVFKNLSH
jgi:hypothetical protein